VRNSQPRSNLSTKKQRGKPNKGTDQDDTTETAMRPKFADDSEKRGITTIQTGTITEEMVNLAPQVESIRQSKGTEEPLESTIEADYNM